MLMQYSIYIDRRPRTDSKKWWALSTPDFSQGHKIRPRVGEINLTNFSRQISITYCYVVVEFDKNMLEMIRERGFEMTKILKNGYMHSLAFTPSSAGAFKRCYAN